MTRKLYVFGSSHIDPAEKAELKPLLRRIGETRGIIAAEFENDKYTTAALKHFNGMDEEQVRTIVQHEFGKRRVIAPYNFLKMAQKEEGIKRIVSIEPRFGEEIKRLSNAISESSDRFDRYMKNIGQHLDSKEALDTLIGLYAESEATLAKQVMYRDRHMSQVVAHIATSNPGDTLLYTSYVHAASIKRYLKDNNIKYEERQGSYIHEMERRYWNVLNTALNKGGDFTRSQKLMFARAILEVQVLWIDPVDTSLKQEYVFQNKIKDYVRSIGDFKEALADLKSFKKEIRSAVL